MMKMKFGAAFRYGLAWIGQRLFSTSPLSGASTFQASRAGDTNAYD